MSVSRNEWKLTDFVGIVAAGVTGIWDESTSVGEAGNLRPRGTEIG